MFGQDSAKNANSVSSSDWGSLSWAGKYRPPPSPAHEREDHGQWVLFGLYVLYSDKLISFTSMKL